MTTADQSPDFNSIKRVNSLGHDYWSARELMPLLGYSSSWQNFEKVIKKAIVACQDLGDPIEVHFYTAEKEVRQGRATRKIIDYFLSKYALHLIVILSDLTKPAVARALSYFALLPVDQDTAIKIGTTASGQNPLILTKERRTLEQIRSAFSHLYTVQQYKVGIYRIDLYFPEHKIAVECDEYDHRRYDRQVEGERQRSLERTLNCTFIRYNPHEKDFNIGDVIHRIMMLVLAMKRDKGTQDQSSDLLPKQVKNGDQNDQHLQYSLLIEWSSTDNMYVVTLPEWEAWVIESDDLLPDNVIPTIIGRTYVEAAEKGKHAIEVLLGFCIADGHTPPEPSSTLKSPRLREQFRAKNKEEGKKQLASLYEYDPCSGLSLDAWMFSITMAQSLIQDRQIEDEEAKQAVYEEVIQATQQTVKRMLDS